MGADKALQHMPQCQLILMKMDKLRLSIVEAKLSHIRSQSDEGAFRYRTKATSNLRQFTLASGRTTPIIPLSHCHILHHQGPIDIEN